MFSCEKCKTFKNTYFEEHLRTTTSVIVMCKKNDVIIHAENFKIWEYEQLQVRSNLFTPNAVYYLLLQPTKKKKKK